MPLAQLAGQVAVDAVDLAATLHRRALGDLLGPAHHMRVFVHLQKLARVVGLPFHQQAIPGPDRNIGHRVLIARHVFRHGQALVQQLNSVLTRQFRLGFLIEQVEKDPDNALCRVERSTEFADGLGLPRPQITYELSDYTKEGFKQARLAATHIITELMGATELTDLNPKLEPGSQTVFEYDGQNYPFYGAGHLMGTYRMGSDRTTSVVDKDQRSWDHPNLFLVGDGVFPTTGTANPTLTITALTFQAADVVASDLLKRTVQVQANQAWQGTGMQVNGQSWQLAVCTGGQWTANPATGMVGAAGNPRLIAKSGYAMPGQPEGALIGRIGNSGVPFLVGNQVQLPRGQQGELQLCINDDLDGRYGAGLSDNLGSLSVEVRFGAV